MDPRVALSAHSNEEYREVRQVHNDAVSNGRWTIVTTIHCGIRMVIVSFRIEWKFLPGGCLLKLILVISNGYWGHGRIDGNKLVKHTFNSHSCLSGSISSQVKKSEVRGKALMIDERWEMASYVLGLRTFPRVKHADRPPWERMVGLPISFCHTPSLLWMMR